MFKMWNARCMRRRRLGITIWRLPFNVVFITTTGFHLFHYSTSPKRYNIIDTNEHSIEQWKRGFIYYEVRIFNC